MLENSWWPQLFEKANTYVLAEMMIHNPKVGGSTPATNYSLIVNSLQAPSLSFEYVRVDISWTEQTALNDAAWQGVLSDGRKCQMLDDVSAWRICA